LADANAKGSRNLITENLKIFLFVILGFLPNFGFLESYENKIRSELLPKIEKEESIKVFTPEKNNSLEIPVNSNAAYFVDWESGEILVAKNEKQRLPIASITKLMTALVAVKENTAEKVMTVPPVTYNGIDSTMGLSTGDRLKFKELLHGLLINSGGDAAKTIAVSTSGSETEFVKKMNETAKILELTNTNFSNVIGYDDPNNYSSAEDLAILARVALSNPHIKEIVSKKSYTATSETGKKYYLVNTNQLIGPSFLGVKTGTTYGAGECLMSIYKEGDRQILGILLNSPGRFTETQNVIKWTREAFTW
jgi:serine-type D-Ala-D-Ala carboxypeptidase (penicillin-binding protein 5/6)